MEAKKRIFYQALREYIHHIPGGNPSSFTLCGTNCFVVGAGKERVLIEGGDYPERNSLFLENLRRFLDDFSSVRIGRVFVTHAHFDHFGGVFDVLGLLKERGHPEPVVLKHMDGNKFEEEVFKRYPSLTGKVKHLNHGDTFDVDD
jgi:glyoxylase-like metal-dependent hydrolase (beta-lactamase superfamily II)